MCYRVEIKVGIEKIAKRYNAEFETPELFAPQDEVNGFAHHSHPVITAADQNLIQLFNWGLIPSWCKDDAIKKNTLNAKIETLSEKPSFRNVTSNRCLVVATGYYEWRWNDEKGKNKQKFLIQSATDEIFSLAGIYSTWKNPVNNQLINTFSIVTTAANEAMEYIHNIKKRMPIMLKREDESAWLDQSINFNQFSFPNYDHLLKTHAVS